MLRDKLSRAKARLLVEQPFFGTLAANLELVANEDHQNFLSDGRRFEYNPEYLESLEPDELAFALSNGAMHAALSHEQRQKGRMGWLWQLSTDYAINALLVQNAMALPPGVNYDPRFDGMYAEEIYATLKDEIKNESYNDDDSNDAGYNENNQRREKESLEPSGRNDANRAQQEVEQRLDEAALERLMAQALEKADAQGMLPEGIERFVTLGGEPQIDWRAELHHALDRHFRSDYRSMPPSKKLLYRGIYLPSLYGERLRLAVAIDSSGSVDEVRLGRFIDELESLLLSFSSVVIELFVCDERIRSHEVIESPQKLSYTLTGGGGTDFRPVFAALEELDEPVELLLYFTDLMGRFPERESIETVWIAPETLDVPFGRVIAMGI